MVVCMKKMQGKHTNAKWLSSTKFLHLHMWLLFIDKNMPLLGASPDAVVSWDCYGLGVLEVKSPWLAKNTASLNKVASKSEEFCLKEVGSTLHLSDKHCTIFSASYKCM